MNKKDDFWSRAGTFFAGKGFYIVLFLCVAVIGASAWAMISLGKNEVEQDQIEAPPISDQAKVEVADSQDETVMTETEVPEASPDGEDSEEADETLAQADVAVEAQEDTTALTGYVWPVSGEVVVFHTTSDLIYDKTMADWRTHSGIDISAELGAAVGAVNAGTVESIVNDPLYGTTVTIDHGNDIRSVYSNMAATPTVTEGQVVASGETIGSVGDTAIAESGIVSHLHLGIVAAGVKVDPLDYLP